MPRAISGRHLPGTFLAALLATAPVAAGQLRADEDLASLRDREEFQRLLERLEAPPGS